MRTIWWVALVVLGACFSKPPFNGPGGDDDGPAALPTIAAGGRHACRIDGNNAMVCWGDNAYGQLGDRPKVASSTPEIVEPTVAWLSVAVGNDHSCGLRDGMVFCWGRNDSKESRPDDLSGSPTVAVGQVALPADAVRISAGNAITCAITGDGNAYCWGSLNFGVSPQRIAGVTQLVPGTHFQQIALGEDHACAIRDDGRVLCWGSNSDAQLGQLTTALVSATFDDPQPIANTSGFVTIAAGFQVSCGVTQTEKLVCWGTGASGQIGETDGNSHLDIQVGTTQRWSRVVFGVNQTCAIGDGSLYCFGFSEDGALGDGQFTGRTAIGAPVFTNATGVAAGYNFTCAQLNDGSANCWGANTSGELGNREIAEKLAPVKADLPAGTVAQLVAGDHHTCALVGTDAYCWGQNAAKQINGTSPLVYHPRPIRASMTAFSMLAAGDAHTCGLATDGMKIVCWGDNGSGQLGSNTSTGAIAMVPAPTMQTWTYVAAGRLATCAISTGSSSQGQLWCWGAIPGGPTTATPMVVDNGNSQAWKSIALGNGFGIGVTTTGGNMLLRGFAADEAHRCAAGLVPGDFLYPPQEIFSGLQTMTDIPILSVSRGPSNFGCARTRSNTNSAVIGCWGDNGSKQTGSATGTSVCNSNAPTTLNSLVWPSPSPGIVAVNGAHSCAVTNSGTLACWGDDDDLQSRLSPEADTSNPTVRFGATTDWSQLAAGINHLCGVHNGSSEVACWGRNKYGEIGDGTSYQPSPVAAGIP